ncbi:MULTISPECIES: hypothetical protein [unclassified Mucilaginibacter]|uniref:hypothetical protein n=1 Tax=unclassified Mucilaginibacter TaxID=2617802 RepID=UPI002AC89DCC|nr:MULTISPECIES: hypothetical protein [unclassified Mucilaginibacter]MEB0261045.1 hypothetical protein [Mucilaginibacter sp. 10I4]MEB0278717.1 hypothetical protein [Mucilaginibacter sp. 10B2]MEB0302668.1 hypothetical protein [Mucilaginibacter sp. 5C4]WPX23331.1 hypothetical protein RHM67_18810 [Mucilaginibacter sp. 5C4]
MKIALLCFWIVITRIGYYFLIQGSHSGLYYIQMSNLKDICQYLCFAGFLLLLYDKQQFKRLRHLIIFVIAYCLSFSILMLYPFLGSDDRDYSDQLLLAFNLFWTAAMAIMFLFLVFSTDQFSTKKISL